LLFCKRLTRQLSEEACAPRAHSNPPPQSQRASKPEAYKSRPDQPLLQIGYFPLITVYVLKGETGKRYVVITNDLLRRLSEHHSGHSKAGQIIGKFNVIHTESFTDHKSARLREKFLKSGQGRKWLDKLEAELDPPDSRRVNPPL
jgi:putative endonuclease